MQDRTVKVVILGFTHIKRSKDKKNWLRIDDIIDIHVYRKSNAIYKMNNRPIVFILSNLQNDHKLTNYWEIVFL